MRNFGYSLWGPKCHAVPGTCYVPPIKSYLSTKKKMKRILTNKIVLLDFFSFYLIFMSEGNEGDKMKCGSQQILLFFSKEKGWAPLAHFHCWAYSMLSFILSFEVFLKERRWEVGGKRDSNRTLLFFLPGHFCLFLFLSFLFLFYQIFR